VTACSRHDFFLISGCGEERRGSRIGRGGGQAMAVISSMPSQEIIESLRGTLDFYRWCNLVIVRKYPQWRLEVRSQAVQSTMAEFAYVNQAAPGMAASVLDAYKEMAGGSPYTWKDWVNRLYYRGGELVTIAGGNFIPPEEEQE